MGTSLPLYLINPVFRKQVGMYSIILSTIPTYILVSVFLNCHPYFINNFEILVVRSSAEHEFGGTPFLSNEAFVTPESLNGSL